MEEKYIIEFDNPYYRPERPLYVILILFHRNNLLYYQTYSKYEAKEMKDRRLIRRCMNKIVSSYINRGDIKRQPKPRAIKIN